MWIPGERLKTLHVVCEGSSTHAVIPCGDNDTERSQTPQRLLTLTDAWLRPHMRPRWLKGDPYRAQISDEFVNWCEQRGIEVVDSAGKAKEQQGKVEHHAELFELMLEDVLADVQPQTEYEWGECLDALQAAKNSLLSVSGVSPMQLVFGRNPDIPINLLSNNPDLVANRFAAARQRCRTGGESCLVPRSLLGKQGHVHPAVLSHQCHRLQERVWLRDETWCSDWNRRQTLRRRPGYHSWIPKTDGK